MDTSLASVATRHRCPMFLSERSIPNEEAVISAIEQWLCMPHLSGKSETDIALSHAVETIECTDPDFPPTSAALFMDPENPPATAPSGADWSRVHGNLYVPEKKLVSILPGALRDRWLLGAIACVGCRPDLLLDLFVSDEYSEKGLYTFQFYKHGCWHHVVVDAYLPCVLGHAEVLFACSGTPGELWVSLMEKAYAKLHGSFFSLDGGSLGDALVDLTGGVLSKLKLDTDEGEMLAEGGALWTRLALYCSWGYVMCAMHKVKPAAENATGPGGLLLNYTYNIVDCQTLSDGAQLVCMHNPWPSGKWHGAWGEQSREWKNPDLQQELQKLQALHIEEGTFWISYTDFIRAFNRLYVTQLFPPSWHQLTLHSGWHGRTAGGPMQVQGRPNSTWCCNPQFRVTTRQTGELLLCIGQQDPMLRNGRHVPKAQRMERVGFIVFGAAGNHNGRMWTPAGENVLHDTGLQGARELSLSIKLQPDQALVVIPYCHLPGFEGPFIIRSFSSVPIEMTQVPSPLALIIGGAWKEHLAGGGPQSSTWASNPQFMISTQQKSQVMISILRSDDPPIHHDEEDYAIGMVIVEPELGASGWKAQTSLVDEDHVLVKTDFDSMVEATVLLEMEPDKACLLVPSTVTSGVEGIFELRILSSVPVEAIPMPERKCVSFMGHWDRDSGGSDLWPYWYKRNPRFIIIPHEPLQLTVTLARVPRQWRRGTDLENMIGLYVCAADDVNGMIREPLKSKRAESAFAPMSSSEITYELKPSPATPAFVIVPCTYGPGRAGKFKISMSSPKSAFEARPL